tara:strand:+ start:146 stop:283 length:138 start_codon:yes stop_codon:yes gene_type:complete
MVAFKSLVSDQADPFHCSVFAIAVNPVVYPPKDMADVLSAPAPPS